MKCLKHHRVYKTTRKKYLLRKFGIPCCVNSFLRFYFKQNAVGFRLKVKDPILLTKKRHWRKEPEYYKFVNDFKHKACALTGLRYLIPSKNRISVGIHHMSQLHSLRYDSKNGVPLHYEIHKAYHSFIIKKKLEVSPKTLWGFVLLIRQHYVWKLNNLSHDVYYAKLGKLIKNSLVPSFRQRLADCQLICSIS